MSAAGAVGSVHVGMTCVDFEQVTGLDTAKAPTIPIGTGWLMVQAESQNVRYRMDGDNPTASVGNIIYAGDPPAWFPVSQTTQALLKFIEEAASAKLNIHYFK